MRTGTIWDAAGRLARAGLAAALDAALPPGCISCGEPVAIAGALCPACFRQAEFITEPCCRRCGAPFGHHAQGGLSGSCTECEAHPPPWREGRAALLYGDAARRLLSPLKYQDRPELAPALARHMARAGAALLRGADLLVPVPLHRSRLLARRYNQSALLAKALARQTETSACLDALRRTRATPPLAGQGRAQREAAVAGAFALRPDRAARVAGRRVLLVDDILTTGATASGCTRALLAAGATRVDLLVAARATSGDDNLP